MHIRYGKRCRYAHGPEELRPISRSNQYKTKTCKAYHEGGTCPYGIRCTFIHHTSDKTYSTLNTQKGPSKSRVLPVTVDKNNIWESKLGLSNCYNTDEEYYYNNFRSSLYTTTFQ